MCATGHQASNRSSRLAILHRSRIRKLGTVEEVRSGGSTRERYLLALGNLDAERIRGLAFDGCDLTVAAGEGETLEVTAVMERGGVALTELMKRLTGNGAVIVSCTRREASLEEVFDLVAGESAT